MATITGSTGDDNLPGTADADDITGDAGNDTINAGGGDDLVDGGAATFLGTDLFLDWTDQGGNGADISGGFTQDTGGINVGVTFTNGGVGTTAEVSTSTGYTEAGEPFDADSMLELRGSGNGATWTTTLDFSAVAGSGLADEVENVSFRINDIDTGGWQDVITITAFDAAGNPVVVNFTIAGNDTVDGNTITAGPGNDNGNQPDGSVLIDIAGPVAQVVIAYSNASNGGQLLFVSDVHFEAFPTDDDVIDGEAGNDTLFGNVGNDVIDGGTGNDVIDGGSGNDTLSGEADNDSILGGTGNDQVTGGTGFDTLEGGEGNDTLEGGADADTLIGGSGNDSLDGGTGADTLTGGEGDDTLLGGAGADTLVGGEGADSLVGGDDVDVITAGSGDIVDGGEGGDDSDDTLIVTDVDRVEFDPLNDENGTVFFNDGTTATFTNIENLIVNGGPDGIIQGGTLNDVIDETYVDPNLELIDNNDGTGPTSGDIDSVEAGLGDDIVYAGEGDDTVIGGPGTITSAAESLNWTTEGADGTDLSAGFTQNTGIANLTVDITNDGALNNATVGTNTQYTEAGEPFATTSALELGGDGGPDVATVSVQSDTPLENVSFRLNDIDSSTWNDILTINAIDLDGNPIPAASITLTPAGNDTVAGSTITGGPGNDQPNLANGSVLVEIAGPIQSFEVVYENGSTGGQIVYVTDVHFDAVQTDDDLIHGDQGSDSLVGAAGDDTIFGDQLAIDPATIPSGAAGTPTSVTFDNQSPYAVELAQIDATGAIIPTITIPAGTDFTVPSTTQTNWVLRDPETGDILQVYEAPPDGSTQVFNSQAEDTLEGGIGDDSLSGDFGNDSLSGGDGADTLLGGTGSDTLAGGDGNDSLEGGSGSDTLALDVGNDVAVGGDDADTFVFSDGFGTDVVDGSEGGTDQDVLDLSGLSDPVDLVFNGDESGNLTSQAGTADSATFSNIEEVTGTSGDDTLDASLSGLSQTLNGGDGADIVDGGSATDVLDGGAGNDSIDGNGGDDTITGGTGLDTITGGLGADSIDGGDDADSLQGGEGADTLLGGQGSDTLEGGIGADSLDGGTEGDSLDGGSGEDTLIGGSGLDTIRGGDDADSIDGGDDADQLFGDAGADTILGGAGADTIEGGTGNDSVEGGAGADVINTGDDADFILGGSGDTVDGGEGGTDDDTLYLDTFDFTVAFDPLNGENGTITFADLTTLTFTNIENIVACFTPGTLITTIEGKIPVEELREGQQVLTRDNGYQPIQWIGCRHLSKADLQNAPHLQPICLEANALAPGVPERDLVVSPQHRMLIETLEAELLLGHDEILVKAKDLLHKATVRPMPSETVAYHHIMFTRHEIILANDAWTESFQPAEFQGDTESVDVCAELRELFPELPEGTSLSDYTSARRSARWFEARLVA